MLSWLIMKRLVLISLAVTLVTAGASCTDDDTADPPPPTTTSPATTAEELTDEEQIEQLAIEWFTVIREITSRDGPSSLADGYLAGEYLNGFKQGIEERIRSGQVVRLDESGRTSNEIESISVGGDTGTVVQCIVDGDSLVDEVTGEVLDDSVTARRYATEATRTSDGWRFSSRTRIGEWKGQTQCDP